MRLVASTLCVLVSATAACRKQAPPTAPAPVAPTPTATRPAAPGVTEGDARQVLDAWLAAQNRADFAAYQALYASRFEGIKRAGPRVHKFDRASWLKDRERMFAAPAQGAPMAVGIEQIAITGGPTTARVRLIQSFSRGSFKDRGPKELILARQGQDLRIAREEMLASDLEQTGGAAAAPLAEGSFFFVIAEGVVLAQNPGRAAAAGPPKLLPESDTVYLVSAAVDETRLEAAALRWKNRKLQIFDKDGPACVATVTGFQLLVRVDPHFSTTQMWAGALDDNGNPTENGVPLGEAAITQAAWELAEPILIGTLGGACKPPTSKAALAAAWARAVELPAPALAVVTDELDGPWRAEADAQVRRQPEVAAALKAFADSAENQEEGASEPTIEVNRIARKGGAPELVVARFRSGDGCADFVAATFIWKVSGTAAQPKLVLVNNPAASNLFLPVAAFDLDGDGRLELFGDQGGIGLGEVHLLRPAGGHYDDHQSLAVVSLDCYC